MLEPQRPDERFTLANERTFLAWTRTALGLLAGGIGIVQLVPGFASAGVRSALGVTLTVSAVLAAVLGISRWSKVKRALETGSPMPSGLSLWLVAGSVAVVALISAVSVTISAVT